MTTSNTETDKKETKTEIKGAKKMKTNLPDGVTEKPRNKDEMDLKHIKHSPELMGAYFPVSDDNGEFIGDVEGEKEVIAFINEYENKEPYEIEKLAVVISRCQNLNKTYFEKIKRSCGIVVGLETKYGIQRGMLLKIEKRLLQKNGKQWIVHYTETYGKTSLRSAQDYMALANTPNIIRYAVFGKERLMEGLRAIKALDINTEDPIATLLEKYEIQFAPENEQSEETLAALKQGVDYAIAVTKVQKAERNKGVSLGINPDQIRKLIISGISVNNGFINDLFTIDSEGGDVQRHIAKLVGEEGELDEMLPNIKKLNRVPGLVDGLKDAVEIVSTHSRLMNRIDQDYINDLENCVAELKKLVQSGSVTD